MLANVCGQNLADPYINGKEFFLLLLSSNRSSPHFQPVRALHQFAGT